MATENGTDELLELIGIEQAREPMPLKICQPVGTELSEAERRRIVFRLEALENERLIEMGFRLAIVMTDPRKRTRQLVAVLPLDMYQRGLDFVRYWNYRVHDLFDME